MHPEPAESKQPNAMRMWWEYRKLWFLEWLRAIHPSARENMLAGAGTTIGVIIGIKVGLYQQHKLLLLLCGVAGYGVIFLVYSIVHASTTSAKLYTEKKQRVENLEQRLAQAEEAARKAMAESLRRSLEQIRLNEDLHKAKTLLSEESERFDKANLEISQLYELIRERDKAPEERRPNIELKAVQFPNVIYDRDAGVWHDRLEDRATDYKACVLIFQNNTYSDGKGVDAIDLRAQITWVYDNDSPGPFFSPAAWLDEEYGQINKFPVGWTKKLLIGIRGSEYWDGYDNRRMDASEGRQTHGEMVPFDGTMTVKLIDHTGQSLYEAKWKWEENINTHWPHLRGPFPVDAKIG